MNCHQFEERLNDLLDERLPVGEDESLREHAAECTDCRESWLAQQQLVDFFHKNRPRLRKEWSQQNAVAVVQPTKGSRSLLDVRWLIVAGVGIAAAVLLMFSPAWRPTENLSGENSEGNLNRKKNAGLAVAQPVSPQTRAATNPNEISAQAPNFAMPFDQLIGWQQWVDRIPDSLEEIEQVEEMSPGLRPLRSSFSLAFHALWRTFPTSREPREKSSEGAQKIWWERTVS